MPTIYVNSGAAGANNGTSWTDAYTSMASADGAGSAAGDTILVHKTHSETFGAATTLAFNGTLANPLKIFCVDKDASDALSTGALIACNTGVYTWAGNIIADGLSISQSATAILDLSTTGGNLQTFINCTITHTGGNTSLRMVGTRTVYRFINCTLDYSGGSSASFTFLVNGTAALMEMFGGTIKARAAGHTNLFSIDGLGSRVVLEGVDVQNTVTALVVTTTGGIFTARNCKLPTYTNLISAAPTTPEGITGAILESSVGGTISDPSLGLTKVQDRTGAVTSSLTKYRTGGADDGEQANAHSWELVSTANVVEQGLYLRSPEITRWVSAGDGQTVTIYLAGGATLQNDEVWAEILSPNETDSPNTTAQFRFQTSRCANQGTPANLTTDATSTWNGAGVTTLQKISFTINPAVAGPVIVRVCVGKASTTVYVDPKLDVS